MPGARPMRGYRSSRIGTSRTSSRGSSLAQLRRERSSRGDHPEQGNPERGSGLAGPAVARVRALPDQRSGLLLWRYLGGPWEEAGAFPFTAVPLHQTCPPGISVARERAIAPFGLVEHGHVGLDPALVDQPLQHLARTVGR